MSATVPSAQDERNLSAGRGTSVLPPSSKSNHVEETLPAALVTTHNAYTGLYRYVGGPPNKNLLLWARLKTVYIASPEIEVSNIY